MKRSSDQFEAFAAPNDTPLAFAGIQIQYKRSALRPVPEGEFRFQPLSELPIGVVKVFPGIQFAHFASLMTEKLRGVVLETFGAGNIPGAAQNALLPIITSIIGWFISIFSGSVIIENTFSLNGMGKLYWAGLSNLDFELVLAIQMFYTIVALIGSLLMDISYGLVDPRVRVDK